MHQIKNLSNIWTNLNDIPIPLARPPHGLHGSGPYHLFWESESNMGPAQYCDVLTPTNWTLPSFQPRWAAPPCINIVETSPMDWFDKLNLPRSIHEIVWLSCIHRLQSSLVFPITSPVSAKTIPSPNPYTTIICPLLTPFSTVMYCSLYIFRLGNTPLICTCLSIQSLAIGERSPLYPDS